MIGGIKWDCHRSTDKSYPGDNRLITPKSSHRQVVWHLDVGSSHPGAVAGPKGLGCSPIKAVRELGSERRETVRSPIRRRRRIFEGAVLSTRGPGWTDHWCINTTRVTASSQVGKDKR